MLDLDMSPHGVFVWGAWGVSLLALGVISVRAALASRAWKKALDQLEGPDQKGPGQ